MNGSTSDDYNVLIGCTGSVATIKLPLLIDKLHLISKQLSKKINLQVVCTSRSLHFFDTSSLPVTMYTDHDEWNTWEKIGDPVLHIELRRWADVLVIAPLDANTLAKIASGLCDNLLTCIVRAWDTSKPLLYAPAMNTYMWDHPHTAEHRDKMAKLGYHEIPCVKKKLACGDEGLGAMAEVDTIVAEVKRVLGIDLPTTDGSGNDME